MKIKSIFAIGCAALMVFAVTSCGTTSMLAATMPEATLDLGNLDRNQYVIMGTVSGEAEITASAASIAKENKVKAEGIAKYNSTIYAGDSFKYGFIGNAVNDNMTAEEKAVANATYKMIELARYNNADAILYVNTTTEINNGKIIAKVSGLAVKIKADEGYEILAIPEPEPEPEPVVEVSVEDSEKTDETAVVEGEVSEVPEVTE